MEADCKKTLYSALLPSPTGERAGDEQKKDPFQLCVSVSTGPVLKRRPHGLAREQMVAQFLFLL